ncbi:outer membrane protein assembly factor [Mucilaginibacter sp. RS28]|uniref:Outer membrane protein assembly factor n=1 Tax=Mucilaginibacter straminoryzae TaxID=2932774 RepID=A0A9X1X309_9SPHI|nr:BamA/TamA family outer membrane protein [Mucilaginibacter straminoryzae]MCJ8210277.1 outer membrane protein assembly factor [Mucilaginibacter straminoryzae]
MKKLFTCFSLLLLPFMLFAQKHNPFGINSEEDTVGKKDLVDLIKSRFNFSSKSATDMKESNKEVYFSFLPGSSSIPGGGRALITTTTASFYAGDRTETNISSVTFAPYWNFKGRFGLPLRSELWLSHNDWVLQGDTRFLEYPQYTWGVNANPTDDRKLMVDYKYVRFYQSLLRRVTDYFFAGVGYNLDYHAAISTDEVGLKQFSGYNFGTGKASTLSAGITFNLLYDTRNNALNPLPGCYSNLVYRYNSPTFGSNTQWQSLYADVRKYIPLSKTGGKNMLALWSYYWTTLNKGVPYLDLPSIGWDFYNRSGRGIEQNKYRGESLAYLEAEYRRDITRNGLVGFVLFANATSVSEPNNHLLKYLHPAGGGGLRLKFCKQSNTNIAIDYAVSKGNSTVIIGLGEAF